MRKGVAAGEGIKTVLLPAVVGSLAFVCNGWAPEEPLAF